MPSAQINVPTGLPRAALRQAVTNVSAALSTVLDAPLDHLWVWVNEVDAELWSGGGPFVHVTLIEGRPKELLQHLIREITDGVTHALGNDRHAVRVVVTPAHPDLWGIGGVPATVVRAEELAARSRAQS